MTPKQEAALRQALEALEEVQGHMNTSDWFNERVDTLRTAIEQAKRQQAIDKMAEDERELGIQMQPEPVTMDDAIAAGDGVLMNEQAALLRECRAALDSLIQQKPTLAGLLCGSTTLGNLKASLYDYRPHGVFGTAPPAATVKETTGQAPCARHCEATAFKIMIRNLEGEISRMKTAAPVQEPVAWMVYTLDGKSVFVTDNPADFTDAHRALPLYTTSVQENNT